MEGDIEIPKHYATMFKDNIEHLVQNGGSILLPYIDDESGYTGKGASPVVQFGKSRGQEKTDRYGDTPQNKTPRDRRWLFPKTFDWGDLLDPDDDISMVIDPTSSLSEAAMMGLGEDLDYEYIIPGMLGNNQVGEDGAMTTVSLSAGNIVGVQVGSSPAADTGMNVKKLQTAHKILRQNKALRKLRPGERPYVAITAQQEDELFDDAKAIHGDYIVNKAVESGELGRLFKFEPIIIEDLPLDANGDRECPFWLPSGVHCGFWRKWETNIAPNPAKRFHTQIYIAFRAGVTRLQEAKVGKILCKV